jgi:hypothetical protein
VLSYPIPVNNQQIYLPEKRNVYFDTIFRFGVEGTLIPQPMVSDMRLGAAMPGRDAAPWQSVFSLDLLDLPAKPDRTASGYEGQVVLVLPQLREQGHIGLTPFMMTSPDLAFDMLLEFAVGSAAIKPVQFRDMLQIDVGKRS